MSGVLQLTCNQQKIHLSTKWFNSTNCLRTSSYSHKWQAETYKSIYLFVVYFNDAVSISGDTISEHVVTDWAHRRGCGRKLTRHSAKYAHYTATCPHGPTKIIRDSQRFDRNSNQAPSKLKAKSLPGEPIYSAKLHAKYSWPTLQKFGVRHSRYNTN
jgi:hypothetical protein